uniref:Uncharacterized protein n=1 Tax=Anguilla anguilla TaxID=7936 RepID=A0A0E9UDR6_ANGAN
MISKEQILLYTKHGKGLPIFAWVPTEKRRTHTNSVFV